MNGEQKHRVIEWLARDVFRGAMAGLLALLMTSTAAAQLEFERPPIDYAHAPSDDPVARLQQQMDSGAVELEWDESRGYLDSLLELLEVPSESQSLVFSKTSLQLRRITPRRPRALYFNDEVYLGWVQRGDVVEVVGVDDELGPVFYTLEQKPEAKPQFVRDRGQCLTCHASSRTQGVPGVLVRSVFSDEGGQPILGSGTFTTDHRSPFTERWGGWYVTGTHGEMRHMGNEVVHRGSDDRELNRDAGANVTDLSDRIRTEPYKTSHSDLVALMVLEHQTQMQNLITLAHYETRMARHHDSIMNEALERDPEYESESTGRRIAAVRDKLLRGLLFVDEFRLEAPVSGTSGFAETFSERGHRDSQGRSLRDFDLQTRLFRYPCSYLIESPGFAQLPAGLKQAVTDRLWDILNGEDDDPDFRHLTAEDRQAIREILLETMPDLWPEHAATATE